jgi:hypothetical protein
MHGQGMLYVVHIVKGLHQRISAGKTTQPLELLKLIAIYILFLF